MDSLSSSSKLANIIFTLSLAKRLEGTRVSANAVHPGTVKTEMGRNFNIVLVSSYLGYANQMLIYPLFANILQIIFCLEGAAFTICHISEDA